MMHNKELVKTGKKAKLTATDHATGTVFARKTNRIYTHVVLVQDEEGVGAIGWCGRYDLAVKTSNAGLANYYRARGATIRIIEVDGAKPMREVGR